MNQQILRLAVMVLEFVFGWLRRFRNRYREEAMKAAFDRASTARSVLEGLHVQTGAGRALLLHAHNGGGKVSEAGRDLKSSVMDEVAGAGGPLRELVSPLQPLRPSWQAQPLDDAYRSLLRRLVDERVVILRTPDLVHGTLRAVNEAMGVQVSVVAHVAVIGDSYLYLSLDFAEVPVSLAQVREAVRAAANSVRRAFEGGRR